jgi:hypothetical protein
MSITANISRSRERVGRNKVKRRRCVKILVNREIKNKINCLNTRELRDREIYIKEET